MFSFEGGGQKSFLRKVVVGWTDCDRNCKVIFISNPTTVMVKTSQFTCHFLVKNVTIYAEFFCEKCRDLCLIFGKSLWFQKFEFGKGLAV